LGKPTLSWQRTTASTHSLSLLLNQIFSLSDVEVIVAFGAILINRLHLKCLEPSSSLKCVLNRVKQTHRSYLVCSMKKRDGTTLKLLELMESQCSHELIKFGVY